MMNASLRTSQNIASFSQTERQIWKSIRAYTPVYILCALVDIEVLHGEYNGAIVVATVSATPEIIIIIIILFCQREAR